MALSKTLRALILDVVRHPCRSELDQLLIEISDYAEELEKNELYSELDQLLIEIASACNNYADEIEKDEVYIGRELDINRLRSLSIALYHVVRNQGLGNEPVCEQTIIDEED